MFSFKYLLVGIGFGVVACIMVWRNISDGYLHVVFCDVGQGDGAYIRMPDGSDMVIDGGPDHRILSCLGKHMPFWDRTIDVVMMTHPQKDHMYGLLEILRRYRVSHLIAGTVGADIPEYQELLDIIERSSVNIRPLYQGESMTFGSVTAMVIWPSRPWTQGLTTLGELSDGKRMIQHGGVVLGQMTQRDLNDFSYYLHLRYGLFDTLFTGDGDIHIQPDIVESGFLTPVEVLKFPHHGSGSGILPEVLELLSPDLSVISVGKNTYGHPSKDALDLLSTHGVRILRTDKEGDIEIVSDGTSWWVM